MISSNNDELTDNKVEDKSNIFGQQSPFVVVSDLAEVPSGYTRPVVLSRPAQGPGLESDPLTFGQGSSSPKHVSHNESAVVPRKIDPDPLSDLPNLALHRPATQSSFCMFSKGTTPEDDAAGGNNGVVTGGAGFHTGYDLPSWWRVDLGMPCLISRIRIYNRLDFPERLRHFSLIGSVDGRNWSRIHQKCDDTLFGGADGHPFQLDLTPSIAVRFLKVQQDERLFLHFDEFQAFGVPDPSPASPPLDMLPIPVLRGRSNPALSPLDDPTVLGLTGIHQCFELFPALLPPPQIPMRTSIEPPQLIIDEHQHYPPPPPVRAYAISGAELWGSGVVTLDRQFLLPPDCLPGYFAGAVDTDNHGFDIPVLWPENWPKREVLKVDLPVACVVNPNMVYGHFLLEMLPRLYVMSIFRQMGARFYVALPFSAPGWVRPFVDLYFPRNEQIWYGTAQQMIDAPSVIIPSMMNDQYNFHPAFNLMVADLRARVGLPPAQDLVPRALGAPRYIYISRRQLNTNKRLLNEDDIEALMQRLGFVIVHPQTLSIREQLELFDAAEVVVGEYSSALHNTLFCRPGTRVISLDFYSWYQSAIGRLRRLPHGFVAPQDGEWRHWRLPGAQDRSFTIDPQALEAMVHAMVPELAQHT